MTTSTYKCPKCNGSGFLSCYANVAGGVCFSCKGAGVKPGKAPVPSKRFCVTAVLKESGERISVFFLNAKTSAKALDQARTKLSRGTGYFADTAQVQEAA